ncbi:unnamed protein product [Rotaria sp. Silwood2]|nr:unnamed protein product [Rotaria sp. Silwood2]CAF2880820.1 unnamed protein product [Rotaria sp. Silwood2]CAF3344758.1 unnamed protein product [Rotaria sp. Silwood2]CAF4132257.1 unnamed protein product [Rotaria sp. Silwood2]CAF4250034.1 unnamed protein product [Rotaria sp. Silwood2]
MTDSQLQYNSIGSKYAEIQEVDRRKYVEHYTVHNRMLRRVADENGLLTGKRALDLGCGQGYYTRILKALNCTYVLGVDVSSAMIDLARKIESHNKDDIDYIVADARTLPSPQQPFNLVTCIYVFDHAQTEKNLFEMIRTIYTQLTEDGHLIAIIANVRAGKNAFENRKYGIKKRYKNPVDENHVPNGTEIIVTLYNKKDEPTCTFTDYYYSAETYEQIFKEIGFKSFDWVLMECDPEAPNKEFYDEYIKCPSSVGFIAKK